MKRSVLLSLATVLASACAVPNAQPAEPQTIVTDGNIVVDADGLARADVWLSSVARVRTLGVAVRIEGADVIEWTRDDAIFTQNQGRVIPLESKVDHNTFNMVVGTTQPGTVGDAGVRIASFVLKPRAGETPRLVIVDDGKNLGAVDASGKLIDIARAGNLTIRTGGAQ